MKKRQVIGFIFLLMTFCLFGEGKTVVDIYVKAENIADSESAWLTKAVAEKLEANLSKYTNFTFVNSANRKDLYKIQKESEGLAFENAIEVGKLKHADYVLFTTLRKVGGQYTVSVRLTNVTTGENKVSAILSSPKDDVQNLYSQNGCAVDEITIELCKALGNPLSKKEATFLMKGEIGLQVEEKQAVYEEDVNLYNKKIEQLDKELSLMSSSTDLEAISKQEKLKAEKVLAEEKLKLAQENKRRVEEEIRQRKADELKNSVRTSEQKQRLNSMTEELNRKVNSIRNAKFENESLLGQIKVIELKKKAIIDIHNSIMEERNKIYDETLKNVLSEKKQIDEKPYRAAELLEDGKTPSSFALEQRENVFNKKKDNLISLGQSDIDLLTGKLTSQKNILLKELSSDYSKLSSKKISTLGNELVVTYGSYNGDKKGWPLYVTVKSDNVILFQTKSLLPFRTLTGKDADEYALYDYDAYLDDVDFYDSLFLRGEPILIFEIEYSAKPEDSSKPSEYNFSFRNFKCYDTQSINVSGNNLSSSKTNSLSLEDSSVVRQMTPVCNLEPAIKTLPSLKSMIDDKLESLYVESKMEKAGMVTNPKKLPRGTNGSSGTDGVYVLFGNWPQSIKKDSVTINTSKSLNINNFTCYEGSDNAYYVKVKAKPYSYDYEFSNGKTIVEGNEYYFKMEPIKWRVLTNNYQGGNLLVAENVLIDKRFDDSYSNDYESSEIRVWLNNEFINSAFTKDIIESINTVNINNLRDKIFLLSEEDATSISYGFNSDKERIRTTTDYAKAMGSYSRTDSSYKNNTLWWLRTPEENSRRFIKVIGYQGDVYSNGAINKEKGIVPSLSVSFE